MQEVSSLCSLLMLRFGTAPRISPSSRAKTYQHLSAAVGCRTEPPVPSARMPLVAPTSGRRALSNSQSERPARHRMANLGPLTLRAFQKHRMHAWAATPTALPSPQIRPLVALKIKTALRAIRAIVRLLLPAASLRSPPCVFFPIP